MSGDANVGSIEAVRDFRAALNTFLHEARDALVTYDMEARRALEWLLDTAPKMWQQESRKCQEKITELNIAYQACRAQKLPGGGQPACLEEKKQLDKAKARMVYIQDKIQKTKKWGLAADRQAIEYKGRATHMIGVLDGDVPNALALLDRVLVSLEQYVAFTHTGSTQALEASRESESMANSPPDEKDDAAKKLSAAAAAAAETAQATASLEAALPLAGEAAEATSGDTEVVGGTEDESHPASQAKK